MKPGLRALPATLESCQAHPVQENTLLMQTANANLAACVAPCFHMDDGKLGGLRNALFK